MCLSFVIQNLFGILSPWGSSNYRPPAPFLYEVASHVKNCHFGDIIIIIIISIIYNYYNYIITSTDVALYRTILRLRLRLRYCVSSCVAWRLDSLRSSGARYKLAPFYQSLLIISLATRCAATWPWSWNQNDSYPMTCACHPKCVLPEYFYLYFYSSK